MPYSLVAFRLDYDVAHAENVAVASPKYGKKIKMDDTSSKTLDLVTEIWTDYYDANRDYFRNFV
jgi:hypothetical protein